MEQITTPVEQSTTPDVSAGVLSLADYRAQRETPASAPDPKNTKEETAPAAGEQSLGETDGEEGDPDSTEESAGEGDKPAAGDDKRPAKKGGWQRKLEKQEREIAELKAQLAGNKPAVTGEQTTTKEEPAAAPAAAAVPTFEKAEPQLEDFDSMGAYTKALLQWDRERVAFEASEAEKQAKQNQARDQAIGEWNARVEQARKDIPDYDTVMKSAKGVGMTPAHHALFLESEFGAQLAYDIASNPETLQKFAAMNPLQAAKYFGRLESAYSSEQDGTPKVTETRVSNAPRPVRPVGVRSIGTPDVSRMSLSDYRAARESRKVA